MLTHNPEVRRLYIKQSSRYKTLSQCDGNADADTVADADANNRGDYNSSPCTSYKRANNQFLCTAAHTRNLFKQNTAINWAASRANLSSGFRPGKDGFRPGKAQTSLLNYRDKLEACDFAYRNYKYYTI